MENSNKIIPPHLNAEIYRTDTTGTNTITYLDYIKIHDDGSMLVGCSELTGRYWNGGANIFNDLAEAQKHCKKTKKCVDLMSGTADGCFVENSSKVLLCEDNGTVSIWEAIPDDAWKTWNKQVSASEHDDAVIAVGCLDPGKTYITAGADGLVKTWDIKDLICMFSMVAHNKAVYDIAVQPNSKKNYATASLDCYLSFSDDSSSKNLFKNNCGIRCVEWLDENKLVFGDEAGVLRLVDVRFTDLRKAETAQTLAEFPAAVHKMAIQPGSDKIAVCCDNKIVSVCQVKSEPSVIYHDRHMHSNYVRGLAWDIQQKDVLHTSGWDGEIKTHKISM